MDSSLGHWELIFDYSSQFLTSKIRFSSLEVDLERLRVILGYWKSMLGHMSLNLKFGNNYDKVLLITWKKKSSNYWDKKNKILVSY